MQAERIIERSGERAVRDAKKILEQIERDRRQVRDFARIILRGIGGVIGGILFPSDVEPGTIGTPEELAREALDIPIEVPNVRRISNLPSPRELSEITSPVIPKRLEPVRTPEIAKRDPIPGTTPAGSVATPPAGQPGPVGSATRTINPFVGILASALISQLIQTRTSRPTGFVDPVFPPQGLPTPLTPNQPTPLPSPQPIPNKPSAPTTQCEALADRKKKKKRRKCDDRRNVVWASGRKKGQIAGTKCLTFKD